VLAPTSLPRATEIHINMTSFLFAFAITVIVGIVCGLMPAMQASSNEYERLQESSRRTAGEPQRRTRRALVIAEVSLAVVLMVASGLLLRSLQRVLADPIGFDPANTITMQIQASSARYADDPAAQQFFNSVADAARAVPGVTSAGFTSQLPLSGDFDTYGIHFESAPVTRKDDGSAFRYAVTPGYLETMGIGVQRGRSILDTDRADTPPIALIGDGYAKRVFGDRNPIGEKLRIGPADGVPYTIVGVVSDVKQMSLTIAPASGVYIPETQSAFADRVMTLVVRTRGGQDRSAALRSAIWSVDPDQAIGRVATMHQLVQNAAAERRFALTLFEAFAVTALMLAAAGLYGVLSGSVAERTREIGVRSALGATRTDVLGMVVREGLGLAGIGIVVGVAGAVGTTPIIHAMLFAVSPLDGVTYAAVITLLLGVACVACALPAFRAMRVNPSVTLRSD
jgi:putative ABC transport system permease protein